METRDEVLISLRPSIGSAKILPGMSADEIFQNETLRPVAKLQNELLINPDSILEKCGNLYRSNLWAIS